MNEDQKRYREGDSAGTDCSDLEPLIAPFVEGALSFAQTGQVLDHLRSCRRCGLEVKELRTFLRAQPVPVVEPSRALVTPPPAVASPNWALWQKRLQHWLDVVFPGTVAFAYRDADPNTQSGWEQAARKESETPLFTARQGDLHLTLHVARGLAFGWLTTLGGEPLYPMLVTLTSDYDQESVLNHSDGTFQIRWNPEATLLECQSPTGVVTRFPLPGEA